MAEVMAAAGVCRRGVELTRLQVRAVAIVREGRGERFIVLEKKYSGWCVCECVSSGGGLAVEAEGVVDL